MKYQHTQTILITKVFSDKKTFGQQSKFFWHEENCSNFHESAFGLNR